MLVEMKVASLELDPLTQTPIVLLRDLDQRLAIPIWVGRPGASAISAQLKELRLARPTTHDLLRCLVDKLGGRVLHVVITDLQDNTYFSKIVIQHGERVTELDARPSDAIAVALGVGCRILVEQHLLDKASCADPTRRSRRRSRSEATLSVLPVGDLGKWKM